MRTLFLLTTLLAATLAGCMTEDESIKVAFVAKDTATAPHEDLDRLAAFLEAQTGRDVTVDLFTSSTAALEAVRFGQADVASVDGAAGWLFWTRNGMEAIAAEVRGDGRTYYNASAWVRADSDIQEVADLEGRTSCHTGAMKSAGMFMPMSYLAKNGFVDASAYADDISQVPQMARDFFDDPIIPAAGPHYDYIGALRCLSDGTGEVAFVRDTTPADYCTPGTSQRAQNDWCLDLDQYRELVVFGPVPEHPFMVAGDLDADKRADLLAGLLALNDSEEGRDILDKSFGTDGIQQVDTEAHLGEYGALVENLPGIQAYAEGQ